MSLRFGPAQLRESEAEARNPCLRIGIVKQQDSANCRVRVVFREFDEMLSYWLPVVVSKTQNDKVYWLPDPGEQVVCLMDQRDEAGVVLGAIYSQPDRPPVDSADKFHVGFSDASHMEYDRGSHVLTIAFRDGTAITYDAGSHTLEIAGGAGMKLIANAPAGMTLASEASEVTIGPSGVSIAPPLPTSSTVAQT